METTNLFEWVLQNYLEEFPCRYTYNASEWDYLAECILHDIYMEAVYIADYIEYYS